MPEHMRKLSGGNWYLDLKYLGERIQESTVTTDRRIAERILAQKKAEVEGGNYARSKKTFS